MSMLAILIQILTQKCKFEAQNWNTSTSFKFTQAQEEIFKILNCPPLT